jgi:hypothetical protein
VVIGVLYLGLASSGIIQAAPPDTQDGFRTGNILLREYFLQRYLELHGERDPIGPVIAREQAKNPKLDPMAERFIDSQVNQFIQELEQKLEAMKSGIAQLESVRRDAGSAQGTADSTTRVRLRELAKEVGNQAGDLFNMVAIVVANLEVKKQAVRVPEQSESLDVEVEFLEKHVNKAEEKLKALFLQPTHTVDLEELRGANVLTELKAIEQVSNQIRKKTDR